MKTLYLSDLDGTLLNSSQTLSEYTVNTVNRLIEQGMIFSYATARSFVTASKVTMVNSKGIDPPIPLIVYNGAFIMENGTGKILASNYFGGEESGKILDILLESGIYPIVYAFIGGEEKFSYVRELCTKGTLDFLATRKGDHRDNPVNLEELGRGDVFYFNCIDEEEKLLPVYERLKDEFSCVYSKDIYSKTQWLEIMPRNATKASAALQLKEMLHCDKIVCFGDGKNDLSLFEAADECYAVENADEELKRSATAVIESCDNDGVAKFLDGIFGE